jgi:flagellar motor switch protein FliG
MTNTNSNLRKAAVLIRSLDADSAAGLLAQLSPAEAASVRDAIRALGPIDPDEQSDILAEFRRIRPLATDVGRRGVELSLSQPVDDAGLPADARRHASGGNQKRFDFLENAPTAVLVSHLSREHAQTIAVVLSHLAPAHAAEVLAALPKKLQANAVERLAVLGETDSQSVAVLESELAALVAQRSGRRERGRSRDTMSAILAAADAKTRSAILDNLKTHKIVLAHHTETTVSRKDKTTVKASNLARTSPIRPRPLMEKHRNPLASAPSPQPLPRIDFEHLIHLDDRTLAAVLHGVDSNALALALAGSSDELVDRISNQMPKRTARAFQRELRRLGPTRLSDVEAAQRLVAQVAAQQLARRRANYVAQVG